MKRHPPAAPVRQPQPGMHHSGHSARRGAMFHYYLMYLLLTSTVMSMAGFGLHAALKSDQTDMAAAQYLQTLRRLEAQLREDVVQAQSLQLQDGTLVFSGGISANTAQPVSGPVWSADGHVLRRLISGDPQHSHQERFVLPAGCTIDIRQGDDPRIVIRIQERSPHAGVIHRGTGHQPQPASAHPGSAGVEPLTVEMHLFPRPRSQTSERLQPPTSAEVPATSSAPVAADAGSAGAAP